MKQHILYCLILLCMMSACEKELPHKFDNSEAKLVMNALLKTEDTTHDVYFTSSYIDKVKELADVDLLCYVNDMLVAKAEIDSSYWTSIDVHSYEGWERQYYRTPLSRYRFNATFHPGDKVRLEATANQGKLRAIAELIAPAKPEEIMNVDTASVMHRNGQTSIDCMQFKIRMKDFSNSGNSYYRIALQVDKKRYMHAAPVGCYHPEVNIVRDETTLLQLDSREDPIISDGEVITNEDGDIWGTYVENLYTIFTNQQFKGSECNLKVFVRSFDLDKLENVSPKYTYEEDELGRRDLIYFDSERIERTVKISLQNISADYYRYLRAMNFLRYDNYEPALTEPIAIPNNVKEGIGFVGISTSVSCNIRLADIKKDDNIYY